MQLIQKVFIGGFALMTFLPSQGVLAESGVVFSHEIYRREVQDIEIKGVVRFASTRQPVAGANVSIEGVSVAITENDGTFTLKAPSRNVKILVQYAGYQDKIVFSKEGQEQIDIVLYEADYNPSLRTAIQFNQETNKLSTAAAIEVVDLRKYQWSSTINENAASVLQGKVAGLNAVRRSGTTNAGANITLRGINSFYGTSQPLLVVDGMLYEDNDYSHQLIKNHFESGLANIDLRDIDNITVLKDGSSQYGTKGSNGVIFITTSHANELATRINFGAFSSFNQRPKALPLMKGNAYRSYLSEILSTQGLSSAEIAAKPYFAATMNTADYYSYNNDTDWQSVVFDHSISQNYYLKVTGGDNIAKYSLSTGYINDQGILLHDEITKYSMRLNGDLQLSKKFSMQSNLSFYYNQQNLRDQGIQSFSSPLSTALVKSPMLFTNVFGDDGSFSPRLADVDIFNQTNPAVLVSENTIGSNTSYRFIGNIHFNFVFNDRYSVKSIAGLVYDKGRENFFLPEIGVYAENLPIAEVSNQSGAEVRRMFNLFNDTYLDAKNKFGQHHQLHSRLGIRVQSNKAEYDYGLGFNTANDDYVNVGSGSNLLRQIRGGFGNWNWMNLYLTNNYSYKDRYLLSWDVAIDGSSRFGSDPQHNMLKFGQHAFAFNSAAHAAWIVSAENFFTSSTIDLLKLRGSFGWSGNDDIGDYAAKSYYLSQNLLGVQGLIRGNIGNPQLQWERAVKTNFGADMSFAQERVNVSLDLYQNQFKDIVTYQSLQAHSGIDVVFLNGGAMRNTGIELGINGRVLKTKHTTLDLGVQLSKYKNKVTALPNGSFETSYYGGQMITQVGTAANQFYGLQTNGVYTTSQEAASAGLNRQLSDGTLVPFQAGDVHYVDQNGDNIIDDRDRVIIGNPNPAWFGAFTTALNYKNWSFNTLFTYSLGNDLYNAVRRNSEGLSNYDNQSAAVVNRWKEEGQQTNIPRANWGDPMGNAAFSDRWIEDGSYLRLRTVSVSYRLPLNKAVLKSVQVYLSANNLFTLSKYLGYDPEFSASGSIFNQGVDIGLAPQYRTFQLGLRAGF